MDSNYILEINELSKKYPNFLLDNINLQIPYGKIVGLIGENGAGKTTLINLILNQQKRDNGQVKVFGLDNIQEDVEIKKNIGFVFDECCFHPCLNPNDIKIIMSSIYKNWDNSLYADLLSEFDILIKKNISDMSKGMKTKLMLAVAMSHKPRLLILDEVTSGLDPVVRDDILQILSKFIDNKKRSVLFSTHITSDLDKIADYVAFLHHGSLVFMSSIEEIRQNYLLVKCSDSDYEKINHKNIIVEYKEENTYKLLLSRAALNNDCLNFGYPPTIDDIMLLYIKGTKK